MQIIVTSRSVAEQFEFAPGEACISIANPNQTPAKVSPDKLLRLGFHDTERAGGNFTVMSLQDALSIFTFIQAMQREGLPKTLLVHCQFGASRSVAVGMFLAVWLQAPLTLTEVDLLIPNNLVLTRLRLAALWQAIKTGDGRLMAIAARGVKPWLPQVMTKELADTY